MSDTISPNRSIEETAAKLIAQRDAWEKSSYASSNAELYKIIGGCVDLYNQIKLNATLAKGLNEVLRSLGVPFTTHTSLELRIARLVFATEDAELKTRNRVNAYARVIRVAADHKQTSATIAQFIANNHGIEEIRRSGVGNAKVSASAEKAQNRGIAEAHYASPNAPTIFASFTLPTELTPEAGHRYSVALVRQNADGTGSIVYGTSNTTVVNTVLSHGGKRIKEAALKQAEQNLMKQQEAQLSQNVQEFAAALGAVPSLQQIAV